MARVLLCNSFGTRKRPPWVFRPENRFLVEPERSHEFRSFLMDGTDVIPTIAFTTSHA